MAERDLHELLHVSLMAPDLPLNAVSKIARYARMSNACADITGLLVFDGEKFG